MSELTNEERGAIFAEEALVVDAQIFLHELMNAKKFSRADLARAMGFSRARVTQLFSDECSNLTVRSLARAAYALGEEITFDCDHFKHARLMAEMHIAEANPEYAKGTDDGTIREDNANLRRRGQQYLNS